MVKMNRVVFAHSVLFHLQKVYTTAAAGVVLCMRCIVSALLQYYNPKEYRVGHKKATGEGIEG